MKLFRTFKSNFIFLALVVVLVFSGVTIYFNQSEMLRSLELEKIEKEKALEDATSEYNRALETEKTMNTADSKEKQIRERLNMIKRDEIQFIFSE